MVRTFYRNTVQRLQVEGVEEGCGMQRRCCSHTADSQSFYTHSDFFVSDEP